MDNEITVSALADPAVREDVKGADVIMGLDSRDKMVVMYGVAALRRIVRRDNAEALKTIIIRYDQDTDQLEYLVAAVKTLKGACCYDR